MKNIGLYIHVPFCAAKCPYCDFYSVDEKNANKAAMDEYVKKTARLLRSYAGQMHADTVYFGGGTPSLLGTDNLCTLLDAASEAFGNADEVTIEVNPRSAMKLDFSRLAAHGLNRVSMGLQSANDGELELLGRRHTAAEAAAAVRKIQSEGIDNISLDLMLGIPGQTARSLKNSVEFCASLDVRHISAYILKIEDGTPYGKMRASLSLPDEDAVCDLYELAVCELEKHGYMQYEISNFAKKGRESRHNLKYWHCEEYLGIGPAAHSFIDGKRFYYGRSIDDFYAGKIIPDGEGGGEEEYIAMAMRLNEGLTFGGFYERFGYKLPEKYHVNAKKLLPTGLLKIDENGVSLTAKGFLCSNTIIAEILYGA